MKKNSQLHLFLETELLDSLKEEAKKRMITVSELCRLKIKGSSQIDNIEMMVSKILNGRKN